jgi:hypothetical protein
MDKFESSYSKFIKAYEPYKVACTQCEKLFISASDQPFVCLACSVKWVIALPYIFEAGESREYNDHIGISILILEKVIQWLQCARHVQ